MNRKPFRKSAGHYEVASPEYPHNNKDASLASLVVGQHGNSQYKYGSFSTASSSTRQMDSNLGIPAPQESPKSVEFNMKGQHEESKKKYLTAKYGAHQMLLIKKRLNVEMWIFDELRKLYDSQTDDHDCELELEDILNLDTDSERRAYALKQLQDAKQPAENVSKFVDELLKRAKTL